MCYCPAQTNSLLHERRKIMPHRYPTLSGIAQYSDKFKYSLLISFALFLGVSAFFFNSPQEIWQGNLTILTSPANLLTDYMALTNVGAALFNASFMTLQAVLLVSLTGARVSGPVIAAVLTVAGFSLFGKNFYNSMPIVAGAFAYAKVTKVPLERSLLGALFGTALGPLVSELSFNVGLDLPIGILFGIGAGFISGFLIPPLAHHFVTFTKGFSLYNIGFTCGIIGTFFISLMRNFGFEVETASILASGYNLPFSIMLYVLFGAMLLLGFWCNRWTFKGLKRIMRHSGQLSTDYIELGGLGATLTNMALLGIATTSYILLLGGEINGPIIGGIFTVVGFGAFGKNLRNVTPIIIGVTLMGHFNYQDNHSTAVIIAALFGTTLAPMAGRYGTIVGIITGALHLTLVMNIGYLHGGVNLYNNGFSGGLVASMMVPLLEALHVHQANQRALRNPIDPADEIENYQRSK
jgi:hypothetical protein